MDQFSHPDRQIGGVRFSFKKKGDVRLEVGSYSYGTIDIHSYQDGGLVSIGRYTSISEITILLEGNHHTDITTFPMRGKFVTNPVEGDNNPPRPVVIGNDVWIGIGVTILDGVTIGDGAIVGAGSIISRDVQPYSVVVGSPATKIKSRFSEEEIDMLMKVQLWEHDYDLLEPYIDMFYSRDVPGFTASIAELRCNLEEPEFCGYIPGAVSKQLVEVKLA